MLIKRRRQQCSFGIPCSTCTKSPVRRSPVSKIRGDTDLAYRRSAPASGSGRAVRTQIPAQRRSSCVKNHCSTGRTLPDICPKSNRASRAMRIDDGICNQQIVRNWFDDHPVADRHDACGLDFSMAPTTQQAHKPRRQKIVADGHIEVASDIWSALVIRVGPKSGKSNVS